MNRRGRIDLCRCTGQSWFFVYVRKTQKVKTNMRISLYIFKSKNNRYFYCCVSMVMITCHFPVDKRAIQLSKNILDIENKYNFVVIDILRVPLKSVVFLS